MPTYTKLFSSIVTSTIWTEDDKTRILWITMLAIADQHGEIQASIPGLARLAAMSIKDVEHALEILSSPDEYSRTPDNEGRRIAKIDGGWELLNHAKYRAMASKDDSKAATAKRVARHRARDAASKCNADVTVCNGCVTHGNGYVTVNRDIAEAEADTDTEAKEEKKNARKLAKKFIVPSIDELRVFARELGMPESDGEAMFYMWESNGWHNGKNKVKCWKSGMRRYKSEGWLASQKLQKHGATQKSGTTYQSRHRGEINEPELEIPDL